MMKQRKLKDQEKLEEKHSKTKDNIGYHFWLQNICKGYILLPIKTQQDKPIPK